MASPLQQALALSRQNALGPEFDVSLFSDERPLLDALRDVGTLPRRNVVGQYDVGGSVGLRDVLGAMQSDPQITAGANLLAEVAPGSGNILAAQRIPTMYEAFRDAQNPIARTLRGAELGLEGIGAVADFVPAFAAGGAALVGLGGMMARNADEFTGLSKALRNQRGIIGSTGAKTADLDALEIANRMKADGVDADGIYHTTGWWLDHPDGVPRFEIDDSGAMQQQFGMGEVNTNKPQTIADVLRHPELEAAYVGMGETPVMVQRGNNSFSQRIGPSLEIEPVITLDDMNWVSKRSDKPKSTTLHELQHAIQSRENMARGGSPEMFRPRSLKTAEDFDAWESAGEQYRRLAGESEARLVQQRMNLTPAERAANPFYREFDVPIEDQIVRMEDGTMQAVGLKPHQVSPTSKEWADFSIDDINRAAFGFTESDITKMTPADLAIKWDDDLENVAHEISKSGKTQQEWANGVNLSEPIEVIYEGGAFKIDDGHHRYMAAKIKGVDLPVTLEIKDQPFRQLVEGAIARGEQVHPEMMDAAIKRGMKPQPLPTDTASRMQRAREWGDTGEDFYHGSVSEIDEFSPEMFGSNTGAKDAELGVWLTNDPQSTDYWMGYDPEMPTDQGMETITESNRINDLLFKEEGVIQAKFIAGDLDPDEYFEQVNRVREKFAPDLRRIGKVDTAPGFEPGANITPVRVRGDIKEIDYRGIYDPDEFSRLAREAESEGFDGIRFKGVMDLDESPRRHDQVLIDLDPKNIRSKFAQFDPAKRESADLLAGGVGGLALADEERRKELSKALQGISKP